jgi:hypothetical protein
MIVIGVIIIRASSAASEVCSLISKGIGQLYIISS